MSILEVYPTEWELTPSWDDMRMFGRGGSRLVYISIPFKPYFTVSGRLKLDLGRTPMLESTVVGNNERFFTLNRENYERSIRFIKDNCNVEIVDENQTMESKFFSFYQVRPGSWQTVYNMKRLDDFVTEELRYRATAIRSMDRRAPELKYMYIGTEYSCGKVVAMNVELNNIGIRMESDNMFNDLIEMMVENEVDLTLVGGEGSNKVLKVLEDFNVLNLNGVMRRIGVDSREGLQKNIMDWLNFWGDTHKNVFNLPIALLIDDVMLDAIGSLPSKRDTDFSPKYVNGVHKDLQLYSLSKYQMNIIGSNALGRNIVNRMKRLPFEGMERYFIHFLKTGYFAREYDIEMIWHNDTHALGRGLSITKLDNVKVAYVDGCSVMMLGREWKEIGLSRFVLTPCNSVKKNLRMILCSEVGLECPEDNEFSDFILIMKITKEDMVDDILDEVKARVVQQIKSMDITICEPIDVEYVMTYDGPSIAVDEEERLVNILNMEFYKSLRNEILSNMKL